LFVFRVSREVAALANTLGGLDRLVFTAGIGEHSAIVRKAICKRLEWLGAAIDDAANDAHAPLINRPNASVEIHVIPTDEEIVVARHTLNVMRQVC
jgi:acetate kinase